MANPGMAPNPQPFAQTGPSAGSAAFSKGEQLLGGLLNSFQNASPTTKLAIGGAATTLTLALGLFGAARIALIGGVGAIGGILLGSVLGKKQGGS